MLLGIGADLCSIDRIQASLDRFGTRFETRVFTGEERARADSRPFTRAATLAKRFAAKEAFAKALGTGIGRHCALRDVGVVLDDAGRPALAITGAAAERLAAITPAGRRAVVHLSLTDDPPWAQAFVVIEAVAV